MGYIGHSDYLRHPGAARIKTGRAFTRRHQAFVSAFEKLLIKTSHLIV